MAHLTAHVRPRLANCWPDVWAVCVLALIGHPARAERRVSFANDVMPVLTKSGCNMGACHGAAAGKNGFYLSLRGYHDDADWNAITRSAGGRRLNPADPGRSLLLRSEEHTSELQSH